MPSHLILLHPGFPATALGHISDGFAVANWLGGEDRHRRTFATTEFNDDKQSPDAAESRWAHSYCGLAIDAGSPTRLSAGGWDSVFLLASFDAKGLAIPRIAQLLRNAYRHGATLYGVETGAVAFAAAGLLTGGEAAIHWANRDGFVEAYPDVAATPYAVARFRRCFTCAGANDTLALVLSAIEASDGRIRALEVAEHLGRGGDAGIPVWTEPSTNPPQTAPMARDNALAQVLSAMRTHIEDPLTGPELAAVADLSQRQLERRFNARFGQTPKGYYRALRLTHAQNLLQQTDMSVRDVATATGFRSLGHFSSAYSMEFGLPPTRDRTQTLEASVPRVFIDPNLLRTDTDGE